MNAYTESTKINFVCLTSSPPASHQNPHIPHHISFKPPSTLDITRAYPQTTTRIPISHTTLPSNHHPLSAPRKPTQPTPFFHTTLPSNHHHSLPTSREPTTNQPPPANHARTPFFHLHQTTTTHSRHHESLYTTNHHYHNPPLFLTPHLLQNTHSPQIDLLTTQNQTPHSSRTINQPSLVGDSLIEL